MRSIESTLTKELEKSIDPKKLVSSEPFLIKTFRGLVEHIAKLSYVNKDYLLFFRGQANDYRNKADNSTFYPSIYRSDYLTQHELNYKFDLLEGASKKLIEKFEIAKIDGSKELKRKKLIQWSILQHYEVCATPLLDITHSIRVACSFAQLANSKSYAYVFVFGLPYITNRISMNSEHDIVNIRLLSICPPQALRPYFQEGYLVGTADVTNEYDSKPELDFNNRLIAKFKIPNDQSFWGAKFNIIPEDALYPKNDQVLDICNDIKKNVENDLQTGSIGVFLQLWNKIEKGLAKNVEGRRERLSMRDALNYYKSKKMINDDLFYAIDKIRRYRNDLVHNPEKINQKHLGNYIRELETLINDLINRHLLKEE